jgi:dephospho-CoA kinase
MGGPLRIGLTGGIASGKSTVTQRFAELGVPVIDADLASRAVVEPGTQGLAQISARFGAAVVAENGELNRSALRTLIFNDPASRSDLEAILHPLIQAYMERRAAAVTAPYVVMAIPLLVEGGSARDRVDRILVIDADEAAQVQRLMSRDGSSLEQAHAILASQAGRAERLAVAHDILPNQGTVTELRQSVDRLHQRYLQMTQAPDARHLT